MMHAVFDAFVMVEVWEHRFLAAVGVPDYDRREFDAYLAKHPEASARYAASDAD
jgi:hypothetical protein